jgi:hypothetical protein
VASAVVAPSPPLAAETPAVGRTPPSPKDGEANWLFQNGLIHTVNPAQPTAEAVAVRGNENFDISADAWVHAGLHGETIHLAISKYWSNYVAEGVGFEPTVRFHAHTLSKRAP